MARLVVSTSVLLVACSGASGSSELPPSQGLGGAGGSTSGGPSATSAWTATQAPNIGSSGGTGGATASSIGIHTTQAPAADAGAGAGDAGACVDVPPPANPGDPTQYSCADQVGWGKCGETWMKGYCELSCGVCTPGTTGGGGGNDGGGASCGQAPVTPDPSAPTKDLLCYLKTHTYVVGQTDTGDVNNIKAQTGKIPAINAFDFYGQEDQDTNTRNAQTDSGPIAWHVQQNGIASYQWHWKAPVQANCNSPVQRGSYDTQWDFQWALTQPCSQLQKDLQNTALQLARMEKAGVPVIYRPLHESNDNYMWWTKKGSAAYIQLYQLEYQILTAQAHNILWVFNGMASGQSTPMSQWYPGDRYVDIVSGDYTQSQNDYGILSKIGTNKIIAISETMDQINACAGAPPFAFSTVWASRDWNGNSMNEWKTAMGCAKSITLEGLPPGI